MFRGVAIALTDSVVLETCELKRGRMTDGISSERVSEAFPPPRSARLVLVAADGAAVGCLPAVPISTPWWPDVGPIVRAIERRYGIAVTILRLLASERDRPHGGEVTYLAEVSKSVQAESWLGQLAQHPLRQRWAAPGGPAEDLAWARSVMASRGIVPTGPPQQIRTWNLSSLWRFSTGNEAVWLKSVPWLFAHEGALLSALAGRGVPAVLGFDAGRTLLEEAPGLDMHDADPARLKDMVAALVTIQFDWRDKLDDLLALGLPDWRGPALTLSSPTSHLAPRTSSRPRIERRWRNSSSDCP